MVILVALAIEGPVPARRRGVAGNRVALERSLHVDVREIVAVGHGAGGLIRVMTGHAATGLDIRTFSA